MIDEVHTIRYHKHCCPTNITQHRTRTTYLVNAHATIGAMLKVVCTTHTTKATLMTMIGRFIGRHPQITNNTVIFTKLNVAMNAIVSVKYESRIQAK
jgi:hypothetical protein